MKEDILLLIWFPPPSRINTCRAEPHRAGGLNDGKGAIPRHRHAGHDPRRGAAGGGARSVSTNPAADILSSSSKN